MCTIPMHAACLRLMLASLIEMGPLRSKTFGIEYEWAKSGMRSRREEYDETQEQLPGGEREKQLERWNRRQMAQEEARNWSHHIITSSHHHVVIQNQSLLVNVGQLPLAFVDGFGT